MALIQLGSGGVAPNGGGAVTFTAPLVRPARRPSADTSTSAYSIWRVVLIAVNVRLSQFRLRAEEIGGGFAKRDQPTNIPWWPFVAGFFVIALIVLLVVRRRQQQN